MVLRKKFLVVGLAVAILTVLILVPILTTNESRTSPPAITGLIATDASYVRSGQIDLAWSPSDSSDFAYYSVYAAEAEITDVTGLSPIGRINDRADVIYETTRYREPGLKLALFAFLEDTEYWFAVTAVDLAGNESEIGTSVSAIIEKMPPPLAKPTVFIFVTERYGFDPQTVTVPIGTTVAWTNIDEFEIEPCVFIENPHTVTIDPGILHSHSEAVPFDADLTGANNIFTYTFIDAGVFNYHCDIHFWETGTVIVEEQALEQPLT